MTIIAISIPWSILSSVIILSLLGETINTMTLGGLPFAVGILVDDATVTIQNNPSDESAELSRQGGSDGGERKRCSRSLDAIACYRKFTISFPKLGGI